MSFLVRLRRVLARRTWIVWVLTVIVTAAVAVGVHNAVASIDDERERWGTTVTAWVSTEALQAGDAVEGKVDRRDIPHAMLPDGAVTADHELDTTTIARQDVSAGAILTSHDVAGHADDTSLVPADWVVVAVREPIPSGATVATRATVSADGAVLARDAIVVGTLDDSVLVAVPGRDGPAVAAAATESRATLLLSP